MQQYIIAIDRLAVSPMRTTTLKLLSALLTMICLASSAVSSEAPRVVVSIKPVHSLAAGVMQGVGEPELLFAGGESPHHMSLKPSQVQALNRADLVVWVGRSLELPLAKVMRANVAEERSLALAEVPGMRLLSGQAAESAHAAADEHHELDPHIWLSPYNASRIVRALAARLSALDAAHGAAYQRNAELLLSRIEAMEQRQKEQLSAIRSQPYIVFHDAYRYFEQHYDLDNRGALALNPERPPGARHLRELRATIERQGVRCLFSEPQFSPRLVDSLTGGQALRSGILDPLGATLPAGPDAYFRLMDDLVSAFVGCLSD